MTTKKSKRTYNAPKGTKITGVEMLDDGGMLVTFDKDEVKDEKGESLFKKGDIVAYNDISVIGIFKEYSDCTNDRNFMNSIALTSCGKIYYDENTWGLSQSRLATPEEQQVLFNALAKEGKRWNAETLEIEDIEEEFKRGDILTAVGVGHDKSNMTFIYNHFDKYSGHFEALCGGVQINPVTKKSQLRGTWLKYGFNKDKVRHATPSEIEQFDNDLKSIGKKWNAETLEIEPIVKFKAGDKVRFKKGLILEVDKRYNGLIYPMEIHNKREDILEVLDDNNFGIVRCFNPKNIDWWSYLPEWLEHVVEDEVKFKKGDILTSNRNNNTILIFDKLDENCEDTFLSIYNVYNEDNAEWDKSCFRLATPEEQQILFDVLKKEGKRWNRETLEIEDLDISEIVVDLPTACEYLNKPMPKNYVYEPNSDFEKQINAQIELQMMCKAWNKFDGFVVDLKNNSIRKCHPVLDINDNIDYLHASVNIHLNSALLTFRSGKRATQFGNQFKELFKTAMGIE